MTFRGTEEETERNDSNAQGLHKALGRPLQSLPKLEEKAVHRPAVFKKFFTMHLVALYLDFSSLSHYTTDGMQHEG